MFLGNKKCRIYAVLWRFANAYKLYYIVGIILAFRFKDNRAFCKYICPVTVFLKPMSYFSAARIKCDKEKCISCGKCKKSLSDEC